MKKSTIVLFLTISWVVLGQDAPVEASLTIEQVAQRMAQLDRSRSSELAGYSVTRRYLLENKRFHKTADMMVRMSYTAPGKKHFEVLSGSGSTTIRKRVFQKMLEAETEAAQEAARGQTQITPENYEFRLVGEEPRDGRRCYVIDVTPRTKNKFLLTGRIWVDAEDFAITRIEGSPAVTPSVWTRKVNFVHRYGKFGPFWLALSNDSESDVVVFGATRVKIEYFDYEVSPAPGSGGPAEAFELGSSASR